MSTEKRLIDANALSDKVEESKRNNPHPQGMIRANHRNEHDHFLRMIHGAPTVDAVEVPCELGHIVFFVCTVCDEEGQESLAIAVGEIVSFSIQKEGLWAYCRYEDGLNYWHKVGNDFGKTVFLSKEEAKAALAKMEGGNEDEL